MFVFESRRGSRGTRIRVSPSSVQVVSVTSSAPRGTSWSAAFSASPRCRQVSGSWSPARVRLELVPQAGQALDLAVEIANAPTASILESLLGLGLLLATGDAVVGARLRRRTVARRPGGRRRVDVPRTPAPALAQVAAVRGQDAPLAVEQKDRGAAPEELDHEVEPLPATVDLDPGHAIAGGGVERLDPPALEVATEEIAERRRLGRVHARSLEQVDAATPRVDGDQQARGLLARTQRQHDLVRAGLVHATHARSDQARSELVEHGPELVGGEGHELIVTPRGRRDERRPGRGWIRARFGIPSRA
jgi:hypothetical protein